MDVAMQIAVEPRGLPEGDAVRVSEHRPFE
jgi:hypothetical protein